MTPTNQDTEAEVERLTERMEQIIADARAASAAAATVERLGSVRESVRQAVMR